MPRGPGGSGRSLSQGLYPAPADLLSGSIQDEWKDAQLYWIVENGLKLTGMPAFGSNYEKDGNRGHDSFCPAVAQKAGEQVMRRDGRADERVKGERVRSEG